MQLNAPKLRPIISSCEALHVPYLGREPYVGILGSGNKTNVCCESVIYKELFKHISQRDEKEREKGGQ